ncbi:hypothetical protein ACWD6P_10725 [Streptomyces sp. NPDC002446]
MDQLRTWTRDLARARESGQWVPSSLEQLVAQILSAGVTVDGALTREAITSVLREAGPRSRIDDCRLYPVLTRAAVLLDAPSLAGTDAGRDALAEVVTLLDAVASHQILGDSRVG